MEVEDDVMEGSVSSFLLDAVESKQSRDVLSLEDVSWVDSCLVKDSEISDSNWDSLKDALLSIVTSQPESLNLCAAGGTDFEILPYTEEEQMPPDLGGTVDDVVPCNEEVEQNGDDYIIFKKINKLKSRTKLGNPFLPNYSEYLKENENTDPGSDFGLPVFVTESSSEDVFRVWDLDIPAEEDELIIQLNKALAESPLQPMQSTFDDSVGSKGLKEESLDDLIAGISDVSLNQNSG